MYPDRAIVKQLWPYETVVPQAAPEYFAAIGKTALGFGEIVDDPGVEYRDWIGCIL